MSKLKIKKKTKNIEIEREHTVIEKMKYKTSKAEMSKLIKFKK